MFQRKRATDFEFSNGKKASFAFPNGTLVQNHEELLEVRKMGFSGTPEKLRRDFHISNDYFLKAVSKASATLYSLNLDSEEIEAFGPLNLGEFPRSHNAWIADGVITKNYLIVYYQKRLLVPDFLVVPIEAVTEFDSQDIFKAAFSGSKCFIIDKSGKYSTHHFYFTLDLIWDKNPIANTLSMWFIDMWASKLKGDDN